MFKYINRFRASLCERGVLSNRTSTTTDQTSSIQDTKVKSSLPCPFRLVPSILEACQRHLAQFTVQINYGQNNNSSGNNSENGSSTKDSYRSEYINYNQTCDVLGAVGWSGILVLGWTILKPLHRYQTIQHPLFDPELKSDYDRKYANICKLLLNQVYSQPEKSYILPAPVLKPDQHIKPTKEENSEKPLTPEEAFDVAAEEFRRVHESVVAESENRRGVACLSNKESQKAIEHFKIAASLKHPRAAFNLGQCYELGIGTNQDFVQAAYWYTFASELGHPTAMYNLGVFYAHGWGGLKADCKRAKQLFLTASNLGQPDAKAALSMCNDKYVEKINEKTSQNHTLKSNKIKNEDTFESHLAYDILKLNKTNLKVVVSPSKTPKDSYVDVKKDVSNSRIRSSLSSSSILTSDLSYSGSPRTSSEPNEHSLSLNKRRVSSEDSSGAFSDEFSEDKCEPKSANIDAPNGNSSTLYNLAQFYEKRNPNVDPKMILELFKMAADHGHKEAEQHLNLLEKHSIRGTLNDYLQRIRNSSKSTTQSK